MQNDLRDQLADRFRALLEAEAYDLWDLEVLAQSGRTVLRVFVDRRPAVTLAECASWSRRLSRYLEEEDVLKGAYVIEVGSPGIERSLHRPEHYLRYVGHQVEIRLHDVREGRRKYRGELRAAGDTSIVVEDAEAGTVSLPYAAIRRTQLVSDPWEGLREPKRKHDKKH